MQPERPPQGVPAVHEAASEMIAGSVAALARPEPVRVCGAGCQQLGVTGLVSRLSGSLGDLPQGG